MPSTPYAKLLVTVNGGAPESGGLAVVVGNTIQLSGESTVGWTQQLFEIYDFPVGFALPAGWTDSGQGTYFYATDPFPPSFVVSPWGKFMLRLTVNRGLNGSGQADPTLVDASTALSAPSSHGLLDLGFLESNQFNAERDWTGDEKANLRTIDAAIGGGAKSWNYRSVTFANSPVTAAAGDWIDCDTTGGVIVVNGPKVANDTWGVSKFNAGANAVNVSLTGGGNINAFATQTIAFQWGSYTLLGTGTGARIIAST